MLVGNSYNSSIDSCDDPTSVIAPTEARFDPDSVCVYEPMIAVDVIGRSLAAYHFRAS